MASAVAGESRTLLICAALLNLPARAGAEDIPPYPYQAPAAEEIGAFIESARRHRFPTQEEKSANAAARAKEEKERKEREEKRESQKKALASTKISRDFADESLAAFLQALREATKVQFAVDPEIHAEKLKVTVKGGARSAEKVLDEALKGLGLGYRLLENVRFITSAENVEKARNAPRYFVVWNEERDAAERKLFSRKLSKDLQGSRVCDFREALAADLGIEVFPDSRAWAAEVALPKKTAGLTVKQLAAILKQKKIELVVEPTPDRARQTRQLVSESVGKQPHPPAGIGEVTWSILLLRPPK